MVDRREIVERYSELARAIDARYHSLFMAAGLPLMLLDDRCIADLDHKLFDRRAIATTRAECFMRSIDAVIAQIETDIKIVIYERINAAIGVSIQLAKQRQGFSRPQASNLLCGEMIHSDLTRGVCDDGDQAVKALLHHALVTSEITLGVGGNGRSWARPSIGYRCAEGLSNLVFAVRDDVVMGDYWYVFLGQFCLQDGKEEEAVSAALTENSIVALSEPLIGSAERILGPRWRCGSVKPGLLHDGKRPPRARLKADQLAVLSLQDVLDCLIIAEYGLLRWLAPLREQALSVLAQYSTVVERMSERLEAEGHEAYWARKRSHAQRPNMPAWSEVLTKLRTHARRVGADSRWWRWFEAQVGDFTSAQAKDIACEMMLRDDECYQEIVGLADVTSIGDAAYRQAVDAIAKGTSIWWGIVGPALDAPGIAKGR